MEILFWKVEWLRPLSLTAGLEASIWCSHSWDPGSQSLPGNPNHCRLRPLEIISRCPPRWRSSWAQVCGPPIGWNQKLIEIPGLPVISTLLTPPCYLTINQSKKSYLPVTLTPNVAFKNPSLKAIRESGSFAHDLPVLLAQPCSKPFSSPNSNVAACLASQTQLGFGHR